MASFSSFGFVLEGDLSYWEAQSPDVEGQLRNDHVHIMYIYSVNV